MAITSSVHQKFVMTVNAYAPDIGVPRHIKQITDPKGEINSSVMVVENISSPRSVIAHPDKTQTLGLNYTSHQTDSTGTYRALRPPAAECTFFSGVHITFSKIDHV